MAVPCTGRPPTGVMIPSAVLYSFDLLMMSTSKHVEAYNKSYYKTRGENRYWGDLGIDWWIILGWISRRLDVGIWTGLGWPRIETGGGRF